MSTVSWQWAKANPDAAARRIRELERENAALRAALEEIRDLKHLPIETVRSIATNALEGRRNET